MPMPIRAAYRHRHFAIGRKGAYEADLLFTDDDGFDISSPPLTPTDDKLEKIKSVSRSDSQPTSPVSVASTLDNNASGEIMSFVLPGAWVVVGKGGKPLKNDRMYDEPVVATTAKKKKNKKRRPRKAETILEPEPLLATLAETAASSFCLRELEMATARRKKQAARSLDAKRWAVYQRNKQLKRGALDEVVAALSRARDEAEDETAPAQSVPRVKVVKDHKANSSKDKARRRARSAAVAARCELWDDGEETPAGARGEMKAISRETTTTNATSASLAAQPSGEMMLCVGPATKEPAAAVMQLPGAFTTVGKGGKSVSDFPPLGASDKVDAPSGIKRLKSGELSPPNPTKIEKKKSEKNMKCIMM